MRTALCCCFLLLLAVVNDGRAQSMNAADAPCRGVVITSELAQCFDQALKSSDEKLNGTYAGVLGVLAPEGKQELVRAQRLWIQYRDATCNAEYKLYEGATAGPSAHLACLEAETRAREASLLRSYGWRVEKFGK